MGAVRVRSLVPGIVLLWVIGMPAHAMAADDYDLAVGRAIALLPHRPEKVVIIVRAGGTPLLREHLKRTDGFVTRGERVVYLVKEGETLRGALKGPGLFDYMLAVIIWHEMAHLDGADEREAMRQEEQLWQQFILQHRVDSDRGLRYLAALRKRH